MTTTDHDRDAIEREHNEDIDRLRGDLREHLTIAEANLRRSVETLDVLAGDQLYDVEYAENASVDDMRVFLVDAARMVRAAAALDPAPETDQ